MHIPSLFLLPSKHGFPSQAPSCFANMGSFSQACIGTHHLSLLLPHPLYINLITPNYSSKGYPSLCMQLWVRMRHCVALWVVACLSSSPHCWQRKHELKCCRHGTTHKMLRWVAASPLCPSHALLLLLLLPNTAWIYMFVLHLATVLFVPVPCLLCLSRACCASPVLVAPVPCLLCLSRACCAFPCAFGF